MDLKDLNQGFQFSAPQAPAQVAPPAVAPDEGYVPNPDASRLNQGGNAADRARGIDPNSGLGIKNDLNYSSPNWFEGWGQTPSLLDAAKQYGPMVAAFNQNPLMTAVRGMKLDPMKDSLLQQEMASYLSEVAPDVSIEDFIDMYNTVTNANFNSKVNAEDTIRGLAMGLNDRYKDSYSMAVTENGLRPDQFAKYQDEVNAYNATSPAVAMSTSAIDPRAVRLGYENILNPVASILGVTGHVSDGAIGRQAARDAANAAQEARYNDIVGQ
jgi:hypothetical protein